MSDKKLIIVPNPDDFKPANIPFGIVTGEGVDNYEGDGKEYTASIILGKKEEKWLRQTVLEFWEENKGKVKAKKPANWETITRKDDEGIVKAYFKSKTHFGSKQNKIAIVDAKRNPLDPEEFGEFGGETTGRIAVHLAIYTGGKSAEAKGVSMFLSAVQLSTFEKLELSGAAAKAFGEEEGESLADHEFKDEKKKKGKKKKGKKK